MTTELYTERVYDLVGDDYTVLSEFVDQRTKIAIKHNKCGGIQEYKPSAFLDGQRCNACNSLIVKKQTILGKKGMPYSVNTKRNVALPIYQSVITIKVSF